ncbi:MAG: dienelactone hydrolase family protein [Verrucomicrobia bacterium]|nr:dienelactone hydrolase family protein [Verrucomicrobiota bacterium]
MSPQLIRLSRRSLGRVASHGVGGAISRVPTPSLERRYADTPTRFSPRPHRCLKASSVSLFILTFGITGYAKMTAKMVSYEQNGTKLEGYLAYDDSITAKGKVPGILIFPEWWGLNDYIKSRADQLAAMGYVAFAADMYGGAQTTTEPEKARELSGQLYGKPLMAERARVALDELLKTGLADPNKIATIGFCFGGAVSLTLAYTGAPIAGVVTFHGGLIPVPADAAQKINAKFLILHGALDPMVNKEAVDKFLQSMNDAKLDFQFVEYSGALHAFTNPAADKARAAGLNGVGYNAEAATRSWEQMKMFFRELFGQ